MNKLLALLLLPLVLGGAPAFASDDCKWYMIGCDAAEKVKEGAVQASENIYSTFNFWTQLTQWYYAGTPEQKEKAKLILEGTFGLKGGSNPASFEVTLSFQKIDSAKAPVRVAVLRDYKRLENEAMSAIVTASERSDLNFRDVVGSAPATPTDGAAYLKSLDAIRADVKGRAFTAAKLAANPDPCPVKSNCMQFRLANQDKFANSVADSVVAVLDDKVQLRGALPSVSFPWSGQPYLTVLIPEADLKANPGLEIDLVINAASKVDAVLPDFMNNPKEISSKAMLDDPFVLSSTKLLPAGRYKIFRLQMF